MKLNKIIQLLVEGPREDYIIDKQGARLQQVASGDSQASKDITQLVDQLSAIDPTKNKQYLQWITKQYINKLFKIEDAPRVHGALTNFNQLKPRLAKKDINQYTLHQLEQEIDTILGGGETDNVINSTYTDVPDSKVLYHGPYGTLIVPQTAAASCELGRGTKWCTAAEKGNMFDHYNQTGPLYIWIDRSGKKYQFQLQNALHGVPDDLDADFDLMKYDLLFFVRFDPNDFFDVNSFNSEGEGDLSQMIKEFKNDRDLDVDGPELDRILAIPPIRKFIEAQRRIINNRTPEWHLDKVRATFNRHKEDVASAIISKIQMIGDPSQVDEDLAAEILEGFSGMVYSAIESKLLTDPKLIQQANAVISQLQARVEQVEV